MAAKKKKAPTMTAAKKRSAPRKAKAPAAPAVPESQRLTNGQFVFEGLKQAEAQLRQIKDPAARQPMQNRVAALKAKFKALPKTKVTNERAERYMAEVQKISLDIQAAVRA